MSDPRPTHPALFSALILPYGASFGYVSVALPYISTHRGNLSPEQAGAIVAAAFAPHGIKFLWAPIVDTTLTKKTWYLIALALVALGTMVSSALPINTTTLPLVTAIIVVSQIGLTLLNMSCETFLAALPDNLKGRASGFYQAGAVGGVGVGGGAALWLSAHLSSGWMVGAVVGTVMLLSGLTMLKVAEPTSLGHSLGEAMRALGRDLKSIALSRIGLLGVVVALSPVGAGAASNYFGPDADLWHVNADTVALVTGIVAGLVAAAGALVGGWLADRIDRRFAYALGGGLTAVTGIAMALLPHQPWAYVVFTLSYNMFNGLAAASFTSLVLETIGRGAVATKYNIFASLANLAITYTIRVDGAAHTRWGADGMFYADAGLTFVGIAMLLGILAIFRPKTPARPAEAPLGADTARSREREMRTSH